MGFLAAHRELGRPPYLSSWVWGVVGSGVWGVVGSQLTVTGGHMKIHLETKCLL